MHGLELPAIAVDEMASDVASRAVQRRGDIVKGAKARKKKLWSTFSGLWLLLASVNYAVLFL